MADRSLQDILAAHGLAPASPLARELAAWRDRVRDSEARWLDAFLRASLDAIIVMDVAGIVREFNPVAQQTFGFTREEACGQELAALIIPPELRDRHRAGLEHYKATGEGPLLNRRIEIEAVRKDGRRMPVELAIAPLDLGPSQLFLGYVRDISDRREAQRSLAQRSATIQLLQQVPVAALEASGVRAAIAVCLEQVCNFTGWRAGHAYVRDFDREVLRSSGVWYPAEADWLRAFRERTEQLDMPRGSGLPGRAWAARQAVWVTDFNTNDSYPRAAAARTAGFASAIAFPIIVHGRVEAVLEFFAAEAAAPDEGILDVLGNVGLQLGRVFERRRSEADLERANASLRAANEARVRLLNVSAHELGTPLTPIAIQVELLKARHQEDARDRRSLEILERNLQRLRHLVQDLLDAARLESGTLRVEPAALDLAAEARRAAEAYHEVAKDAGLSLEVDAPSPVPAVCDPRRISQVFDNLLSNATKFTPRGGRVVLRVHARDSDAVVEIVDTGPGLSAEDMRRLFQPFSQVHAPQSGQLPGSGLGLYISRGFAEACGGRLEAESPGPGQGATFRLRLPLGGRTPSHSAAPRPSDWRPAAASP